MLFNKLRFFALIIALPTICFKIRFMKSPMPQSITIKHKKDTFSCFLIHKTTYRWQFITLPTSELHRHPVTGSYPKSRSIIITDMLHHPAHLLCILSGFYHFMPLLQCLFCISSRPFQNCFGTGISWRTHIVATHILTSYMLCDIQLSFIFGKTA